MVINSYSSFAQNIINSRPSAQKFTSNTSDNPLLLSTPEALTFELIDNLDSNHSGGLSQSESELNDSDFARTDKNSDGEISFLELSNQVAKERKSYVDLLYINNRYSAYATLSQEGFSQVIGMDSEGISLLENTFKSQDRSSFQKLQLYSKNLSFHTLLTPAKPTPAPTPEPPSELYQLIAPLKAAEKNVVQQL